MDVSEVVPKKVCVGCQEQPGIIRVEGLGRVCDLCHEVLDIVFDVEIDRVREACRKAGRALSVVRKLSGRKKAS